VKARLGDRPLTHRPRIVVTPRGFLSVERLNPYVPGSETYTAMDFPEAFRVANAWAKEAK
jgi:hypothetical protein